MSTEASLKKKFSLISAILGSLKIARGVKGSDEVIKLEEVVTNGKAAIADKDLEKAEALSKNASELLLACGKLLPKAVRKLIQPKLEQISRY